MIQIVKASLDDVQLIHRLAHAIWPEAYSNILSSQQIDFMLEKAYTISAITEFMSQGQCYVLALEETNPVGFMAMRLKSDGLRIESLYLLPETRGKGHGRELIAHAQQIGLQESCPYLELNVNRRNPAFHFYQKVGFSLHRTVDIPYHGYLLDDFVMRKPLIA